jgi:4-hydroxybenzoyl-CoA reductase subunit beta
VIRLPSFRYVAPATLAEASGILRDEGVNAMLLAGGTDLLPNMKRRQQQPKVLVSLRRIAELREQRSDKAQRTLGAFTVLEELAGDRALAEAHAAAFRAAAQVATPLIRTQATLGGNLCLDTRCTYYNQGPDWRRAIDFCMKAPSKTLGVYHSGDFVGGQKGDVDHDGEERGSICWVAPGSPRCWAISSSDTAPALIALGADVELVSHRGARRIPLADLYHNDGMAYLTKQSDEILTRVFVPHAAGWRSTYWKLRRRDSFDFPVAAVAAAVRLGTGGVVEEARLVLGAVASRPVLCDTAAAGLVGKPLSDEAMQQAAEQAIRFARPMDNADFQLAWRKTTVKSLVTGALRELRGDDPATLGAMARHARRQLPLLVVQ